MKRTKTKQKPGKQPTPLQTDVTEPTDRNTINQSEEPNQKDQETNDTIEETAKGANKEQSKSIQRKLPNLCDPNKGQLFHNYDKYQDWEEFDNVYKDQILSRFRNDTNKRNVFTNELNRFISRLYRVDVAVTGIVPGKSQEHIDGHDFDHEAPGAHYLFHKLRPHGIQVINNNDDSQQQQLPYQDPLKPRDGSRLSIDENAMQKIKLRKKSQPFRSSRRLKAARRKSGLDSSGSDDDSRSKVQDNNHEDVFKRKVSRLFKGIDLHKGVRADSKMSGQQPGLKSNNNLATSATTIGLENQTSQATVAVGLSKVSGTGLKSTGKTKSAMRPSMQSVNAQQPYDQELHGTTSMSRNTLDNRNAVSFAQNNESMTKLPFSNRIDSPLGQHQGTSQISKEAFSVVGSGSRVKKIANQKSRSRIRHTLKRNIDTTYSAAGLEIDPEKKELIRRQFEDNHTAFELRMDQERNKLHENNIRKVNRSINRLEKQNNNFLKQMSKFRQDRVTLSKKSTSNMRALSGINSRLMLNQSTTDQSQQANLQHMQRALGNVSSVQRIGIGSDQGSKLGHYERTIHSPAHDRSLNVTKAGRVDSVQRLERGEILLQGEQQAATEATYRAAMDISTMLPQIVNNNSALRSNKQLNPSQMRRDQVSRNFKQSQSGNNMQRNKLDRSHFSPAKMVTSREGAFTIDEHYIDQKQREIESFIYSKKASMQQSNKTRGAALESHKYPQEQF